MLERAAARPPGSRSSAPARRAGPRARPPRERRQDDDQRRDHPIELLAVPVGQEEAPRLVEQEVVEVALQLLVLQPQPFLDLGDLSR